MHNFFKKILFNLLRFTVVSFYEQFDQRDTFEELKLSFDEKYCKNAGFLHFFSIFLFMSVAVTDFFGLRENVQIILTADVFKSEDKEEYVNASKPTRVALIFICVVTELLQLGFHLYVGVL